MTDDLVQFLRDRLDEEAALALAAQNVTRSKSTPDGFASWQASADGDGVLYNSGTRLLAEPYAEPGSEWTDPALAAHVARHDPARILADVEAKRFVIDQCAYWNERAEREAADPPKYPQPGLDIGLLLDAMNPILRGLALPHADHPDYREEWRP